MARTWVNAASDVIARVRNITNDEDSGGYRTSDPNMLLWINDVLQTLVNTAPDLFQEAATHTCTAGYRQVIETERAVSLVDVVGVPMADMVSLSQFNPAWTSGTAGTIKNWLRAAEEKLVFYVYPPSSSGQSLPMLIVRAPAKLTATTDKIPLPETFLPALVDYVVAMIELKDDEHLGSGRQQMLMQRFGQRVGGVIMQPAEAGKPKER